MGEGCCLWNQTLRRFLGSLTAFQVSSSQEVAAFLTLMWCIQGNDTYNFNSSRGCQDDCVRACPNWLKWVFFLICNPYLISWLIGMNPIAQRNGCPFRGFSADMAEDFSRAWRCRDISRSARCWWSPLSFFITEGGLPYKISKGE